jgi:hypothetical protein
MCKRAGQLVGLVGVYFGAHPSKIHSILPNCLFMLILANELFQLSLYYYFVWGFTTFPYIVVTSDIYTLNLKNTAVSGVDYKLRLFLK